MPFPASYLSKLAPEGQHVDKVADHILQLCAATPQGCGPNNDIFLLSPAAQEDLECGSQAHDDSGSILGSQSPQLLVCSRG